MREIKFRAWDKVNNRMGHFEPGFGWQDEYDLWYLRTVGEGISDVPCEDNIILMQFTGLKDKNGKDVYEGDILESPNDPAEPLRHVVEWSDKFCGWFARNITDKTPERRDGSIQLWVYIGSVQYGEFNIVGNIYEK